MRAQKSPEARVCARGLTGKNLGGLSLQHLAAICHLVGQVIGVASIAHGLLTDCHPAVVSFFPLAGDNPGDFMEICPHEAHTLA